MVLGAGDRTKPMLKAADQSVSAACRKRTSSPSLGRKVPQMARQHDGEREIWFSRCAQMRRLA